MRSSSTPTPDATWLLSPPLEREYGRLGDEFLASFLDQEVTRRPRSFEALELLGEVLTRLGRHTEGLAVDRRLVTLAPEDATVRYNLACSLALTQDTEAALQALTEAIGLGFENVDLLRTDDDLASLREDPRYVRLVAALQT